MKLFKYSQLDLLSVIYRSQLNRQWTIQSVVVIQSFSNFFFLSLKSYHLLFSIAGVQICKCAKFQTCNCAYIWLCKYASAQTCECANMKVREHASEQLNTVSTQHMAIGLVYFYCCFIRTAGIKKWQKLQFL